MRFGRSGRILGQWLGQWTATAQDIADYLRKGEASTWAESAKATPDRAERDTRRPPADAGDEAAAPATRPRSKVTRRLAEDLSARMPPARSEPQPKPERQSEPKTKTTAALVPAQA